MWEPQRIVDSTSLLVRPAADGLLEDTSSGGRRVVVPGALRERVLRAVHSLHHPGRRATWRMVKRDFVWPSMARDVGLFVRSCVECQKSKTQFHLRPPALRFSEDMRRFGVLHVDLVGPMPEARGFRYLLTMMDRATRWLEAVPLKEISATEVARELVNVWFSRFGVPTQIVSDRGAQFMSSLFTGLCGYLGAKHTPTTSYHPQCNGLLERAHRRLKDALRCHGSSGLWTDVLPWVM